MNVTFDLQKFKADKACALNFFKQLKRLGEFKRSQEIDNFFSKQPSYAYKYALHILSERMYDFEKKSMDYLNVEQNRLSIDNEKIFKKNIKYAIAYLNLTQQNKFRDEKTQKSFENKVYKNPGAAYDYAIFVLKGRIPEDKEEIFLDNLIFMYYYSKNILKGKFPDNIHKKIVLKTFDDSCKRLYGYDLLSDYLNQNFKNNKREDFSYFKY